MTWYLVVLALPSLVEMSATPQASLVACEAATRSHAPLPYDYGLRCVLR